MTNLTNSKKPAANTAANAKADLPASDEPSSVLTLRGNGEQTVKFYAPNDAGNAERFLDTYGEDVRYCPAEKTWYVFDGMRWQADTTSQVEKLVCSALEASYTAEIAHLQELDQYGSQKDAINRAYKRRTAAGNLQTLRSCVNMAGFRASIEPEEFDADDYEFHAQNGSLNLKTYQGYSYHKKDLYFRKMAGASFALEQSDYEPNGQPYCPRWKKFVVQCAMGDVKLFLYLQRAAGYSVMTGDISAQKVFCLVGEGRNGKSLFINTLAEIAGDYACKIESSLLSMNRWGERDADVSKELYRMKGKRFVYANEFSRGTMLNEVFIKAITDGGKISCRPLYGSAIEYTPTYKLWFSTNHLPDLQALDEGIGRRLVIIPFRLNLTDEQIDKTLADAFREEANGILMWLIQGYWQYTLQGLEPPEAIRQETAQYFAEQDLFRLFLEETYVPDENGKIYAREVYEAYQWWCGNMGERSVARNMLGKELQRLGILKRRDAKGIYYELQQKAEREASLKNL